MTVLAMLHAAIAGFMIFFTAAVLGHLQGYIGGAVGAFYACCFRAVLFGLVLALLATGVAFQAGVGWRLKVSAAIAAGFAINLLVLTPQINAIGIVIWRAMQVRGGCLGCSIWLL